VEEETGFDLTGMINPKDIVKTQINAQMVTMFIVGGIDEETVFITQTRKEIGVGSGMRSCSGYGAYESLLGY
jgi:mRNA-decapping enzyme subunit 2